MSGKAISIKMLFSHKIKTIPFFCDIYFNCTVKNTKIILPISQTVLLFACCRSRYNRVSKLFVTIATF